MLIDVQAEEESQVQETSVAADEFQTPEKKRTAPTSDNSSTSKFKASPKVDYIRDARPRDPSGFWDKEERPMRGKKKGGAVPKKNDEDVSFFDVVFLYLSHFVSCFPDLTCFYVFCWWTAFGLFGGCLLIFWWT